MWICLCLWGQREKNFVPDLRKSEVLIPFYLPFWISMAHFSIIFPHCKVFSWQAGISYGRKKGDRRKKGKATNQFLAVIPGAALV